MSESPQFVEKVAPGVRVAFEASRVLHQVQSARHQKVFFDNTQFGRMFMLDGAVRLTSSDEFIYHEMMSHVPLLTHGRVEQVLIIGGGDCGLAEEVLKHPGVERVLQVEIDAEIVRLSRSYFPSMNAAVFQDKRFEMKIWEGADFVASTNQHFDLILVDSADRGANSMLLSTEQFYRDARGCLNPRGVLIAPVGAPFLMPGEFASSMRRVAAVFPEVGCYLVPLPSSLGGPIALAWGSGAVRAAHEDVAELQRRYATACLSTRYYTPQVHGAAFALPHYLRETLAEALQPG
jgi:spermidine synthase